MDAQTVPNFLIIRIEWRSTIHGLSVDVPTGAMCCDIRETHTIFCRHVDHECYYEVKMKYVGYVWRWSIESSIVAG